MPKERTSEISLALGILNDVGYLWTKVKADNSAPLICEGDYICLKNAGRPFGIGDLVALDCLKMFIVQRIVGVGKDVIFTKADHSEKGPFSQEAASVAGKVVLVKKGKYIVSVDNPFSSRLHMLIVRLSVGRSRVNTGSGFFYGTFFHKLRRSALKRLLSLELITGKRYAKHHDPGVQVP